MFKDILIVCYISNTSHLFFVLYLFVWLGYLSISGAMVFFLCSYPLRMGRDGFFANIFVDFKIIKRKNVQGEQDVQQ